MKKYRIYAKCDGKHWEKIDDTYSRIEAERLRNEYMIAFGSSCSVEIRYGKERF